jgi:hypothetical protein
MAMCLNAHGFQTDEDTVNRVMGAQPMKGAAWENALACAQHYGCRATLTVPATVRQLKAWTDRGVPIIIAWNPEGREWSHASVVFDVTENPAGGFMVHVADPNIPNPEKTVRVVDEDTFYGKWYEKWPNYLVRRPACAIEREVTPEGRQVVASKKYDPIVIPPEELPKKRRGPEYVENVLRRPGAGGHHTRERDLERGRSRKQKHKQDPRQEVWASHVAERFLSKTGDRK